MKKILFGLILFFSFTISVNAASISQIDMDIKLDHNGTATITERWNASVSEGTEGWHPYFNIGTSEIKVISASMDGKKYEIESFWDKDATLSEKAYKAGIYSPDSKETDIVFGISEYGAHNYEIIYEITDFVIGLKDNDMIYWTLFPQKFSASPDNVNITIYGDTPFEDNTDVWGFGKAGMPTYVKDGKIYMTSDGESIDEDEYMVILVKFKKGIFEPNTSLDDNFSKYLKMAKKGSYKQKDDDSIFDTIGLIIAFIFAGGIFGSLAYYLKNEGYGYKDNKTINYKEIPMFRDIPCNKDIYYANVLLYLNNYNGYRKTNIMGSILLKWVKEGKITLNTKTTGIFNKETTVIDLTSNPTFGNHLESDLFDILYKASRDGVLEPKELEKWCKTNYTKFLNLFDDLQDEKIRELKNENHIYMRKTKQECKKKEIMDDTIYNDTIQLYGLKKYLDEFSNMKEKTAIEVHIWDEYLMFAYLFGIADQVAKQFKKLYPEVINEMNNYNLEYNSFIFINSLSRDVVSAAQSAANSYSAGGGGFSFGGGGGGSFGGGGGGGGFR